MKKFTCSLLIACFLFTAVHAQVKQGTVVLGGNINFTTHKNDYYTFPDQLYENRGFSVTPLFGWAIRNNIVLGGDLVYGNSFYKAENASGAYTRSESNTYGLGGFVRGYRNLGSSGFFLFLQSRLGAGITESKSYSKNAGSSSLELKNKGNEFQVRLNVYPGVSYAITPGIHIEAGLNDLFYVGYTGGKSTDYLQPNPAKSKTKNFNAGMGLGNTSSFTVGVKFFLGSLFR